MRELGKRILKRSLLIAVVLGLMGILFAEAALVVRQVNGAPQPDPEAASIRLESPLRMAIFGVVLQAACMLIGHAIRRKQLPPEPPAPPSLPPPPASAPTDKP